jgi:hypothetical protein
MAIAVRAENEGASWHWNLQPGQLCFYCYAEIKVVAVMWRAADWDLWLHPKCCQRLMLRLSRDCWEIECKSGPDSEVIE